MNKKLFSIFQLMLVSGLLASCSYTSQGIFLDESRYAIAEPQDHFGDSATKIVYADQNWDASDSLWFYNTSQGSNLIPYDIFKYLEQATNKKLFRSDENIRRYRYLPQPSTWDNSDGLPVGFVRDEYQGKAYIGFTCSACHTNQINYKGVGIRIDGAPALGDMGLLLSDLANALEATLDHEAKFQRLAQKIVESNDSQKIEAFRTEFQAVAQNMRDYDRRNKPMHGAEFVPYGYARLDAFGRIFNQIFTHLTPGQENTNSPNAPVSYPFLWDTPQHDFVQWNGIASNKGEGPLGRNTGEVIGVFASFELERRKGETGFRSSALNRNQIRLERQIARMWSPLWEDLVEKEALPKIDADLAKRGKEVFRSYKCMLCHQKMVDRTDPDRLIIAQFASLDLIGTDPVMANNAITQEGKSGLFQGKRIELKPGSERFGPTTLAANAIGRTVAYVLFEPDHDKWFLRRWTDKIYDLVAAFLDNTVKVADRQLDFETVGNDPKFLLAYKGRPLNGIWATAPYLHNGSVPNLYELFLPACGDEASGKCRSRTFTLGSREFDPKKVGFVSKSKADYPGLFVFDTSKPSNDNGGHEYVVGKTPMVTVDENGRAVRDDQGDFILERFPEINDADRWALVEYLKTL